jgi:predicted ATPase
MDIRPEEMTTQQLNDFQREVFYRQVKEEMLNDKCIMDASVIDILAYAKDSDIYEELYDNVKRLLQTYPYDKVFFFQKIKEIEDD